MAENEDDLESWLQGDTFVTEEQRQEAAAARRRQQRKQRLQQLGHDRSPPVVPPNQTLRTITSPIVRNKVETKNLEIRTETEEEVKEQDGEADEDEFDMFSSSVSPAGNPSNKANGANYNSDGPIHERGNNQDDWDDAEGYYKAVIGEIIALQDESIRLKVAGVVGKGVFSTVIKCSTVSNSTSVELPPIVALKCIRHNDTMAKAAINELETLLKLKGAPGIVPILFPTQSKRPLEHRGHVLFIFPFMSYNLRDVLQKFGKGVGLSLTAVRSYFGQLLAAATHLQKHQVIHADLKPDNILVSADFGVVQLADFGSAIGATDASSNPVTPYMVSRYYRAPDIILGLPPTYAVDLWSLAVTVAEIFLGGVVFRGKSNNDMLYVFMQHLGPFSNRTIRQHLVQTQKVAMQTHFAKEGANYVFLQQTVDAVSQTPYHQVQSLGQFPTSTLRTKILQAKSANDPKRLVGQFADLLQQCFALDPTKRIALKEALRHEFFASSS